MHRSALAPNGVIHLSRPVTAPFVDFQTSGGWRAKRTVGRCRLNR
jgi:hypothetical protein